MPGAIRSSFGRARRPWAGVPWTWICLSVGLSVLSRTHASAGESTAPPVRYLVVVTGGELLSGAYPDGHTFFLTRTLRPLGLECVGSMCVDDKQAELKDALRFASDKATLVIVTGGLGPTDNDITREVLSDFTGIALREHPDALAEMARRFQAPPAALRANLRRQTQVPTRGTYFKNANGTAIGLVFEAAECVIVALPGPPRELQPMVRDELVPYLSRRFGTRPPGCAVTLRFVGLGQSQIDQTLKGHVTLPPNVMTHSQFEGGRVDFTFLLPDDTPQDRARLRRLKDQIVKSLGDHVYADSETTSLEDHVIKLLEARGGRLALAEVGSGGALAAALSGADGADRVFAGAYVAPTEQKLHRLLGIPKDQSGEGIVLDRLTQRLADVTGSTWAIVVGAVQREENGTGFVQVAFKPPDRPPESRPVPLHGAGDSASSQLVTELLDQLRRKLR